MSSTLDGLSLGQLFHSGQSILTQLEDSSLSTIDPEYQAQVNDGIQRLTRADDLISKLHIFSDNEIIDDINTNDLKFLLVTAYLGSLTLKLCGKDIERSDILNRSKEFFQRFLSTCQDHELLKKEDIMLMQRLNHNGKAPSLGAAQQREQKIARFKREKAIKDQIQQLRERLDQVNAKHGEDEDRDVDETEREMVQALIELEIVRSLENWHSIEQELVMVKEMESMREMMQRAGKDMTVDRREPPTNTRATWGKDKPILTKEGKPLQPFVITNQREQIRSKVFGYGHNLPTMTIDEYLEQEMAQGNIIQGGGEPPEKPLIDDNDYEAQDAETMKKREWDEFVEANPRGAGNRGNKG
ncbi:TAP42-like protein [Choanephora cucurbitarum]|nr:TAP42-like protein [Choanephora cucurbitarum]